MAKFSYSKLFDYIIGFKYGAGFFMFYDPELYVNIIDF